ncbi:MAG: glycosyltransferase family 4 protein, partial [Candidatus Sumerlaeaceae bacterium]|nr:glycosyltransferase family 4 protein [Candidatus Sumerlaeaceae bacterium]
AVVVRALPVHRFGGLEYHSYDLAHALQRRGCSVTIVTSRHPKGIQHETLASGVEVFYLRRGTPGDYSLAFFRDVEKLVDELDRRQRFDVIHAQEFAGLAMKPKAGRFVVTIHGTLTTETPLDRRYWERLSLYERLDALWQFKARLALFPAFRSMLKRADRVIVDSRFTQRELMRLRPLLSANIHVVPLGVELARYCPLPTPPEKDSHAPLRIVMLGRTQRMRGITDALAAGYRLRWHGISFEMRIGGTATPPGWVDEAIAHFLLEDEVSYEGQIEQEEVSKFLSWGDVFLFADRTQPAFGLACVEAMLHGLPVVATRVGAIPEVVTDEVGWLCDPWNAQDLTAQLVRIAHGRHELRRKAAAARTYAQQFSADAMAEQTLRVYQTL